MNSILAEIGTLEKRSLDVLTMGCYVLGLQVHSYTHILPPILWTYDQGRVTNFQSGTIQIGDPRGVQQDVHLAAG